MAQAVVSAALQTLGNLLIEEGKFLYGVTDQVEDVQRELQRMKAFLSDADAREHKEERVKNFLQEIRQLAYKAQDILETFIVDVASKRQTGTTKTMMLKRFACIFGECVALHNTGSEITKISSQIAGLTASLERYGIRAEKISSAPANEDQISRQTYPFENEEYFVGMKEDIRQLVSLLLDDDKQHRVISICGMGGLGKTTLAKKVYNHDDVRRHFQGFAWICITQKCVKSNALKDILRQLVPEKTEDIRFMDERELVMELYKTLSEKRSLVVIDDIWTTRDWDSLSSAFPKVVGDSKILLTTRARAVAEKGFLYQLNYLSEDEGWELIRKIAFADNDVTDFKTSPKVKDIGMQIVKKCGCLPLAVSVIGEF